MTEANAQCEATVIMGDLTFRCQKEGGHSGKHRATFVTATSWNWGSGEIVRKRPVTVTW